MKTTLKKIDSTSDNNAIRNQPKASNCNTKDTTNKVRFSTFASYEMTTLDAEKQIMKSAKILDVVDVDEEYSGSDGNVDNEILEGETSSEDIDNITDSSTTPQRKPQTWHEGNQAQRRLIVCVLFISEFLIICGGLWHNFGFMQGTAAFLERWIAIACFCVLFDVAAEAWLDPLRLKSLTKSMKSGKVKDGITSKAHHQRNYFHLQRRRMSKEGQLSALPWLGAGNWHYETSACIRDAFLSLTVFILYWVDEKKFEEWWIALVWGTYCADMLFLLVRWPFIFVGWLRFVSIHHGTVGLFLCLKAWVGTSTHDSVLRCIAMIWLSNVFTTSPIVHTSFTGADSVRMFAVGFVIQRSLRWGGALWVLIEIWIDGDLKEILFEKEHFLFANVLALILLEFVDISSQMKKFTTRTKVVKHREQSIAAGLPVGERKSSITHYF